MILTPHAYKQLKDIGVELSVMFITEELITNYREYRLRPEVQDFILKCMWLMSKHFTGFAVYFTDEITDGKPWETIIENRKERSQYSSVFGAKLREYLC